MGTSSSSSQQQGGDPLNPSAAQPHYHQATGQGVVPQPYQLQANPTYNQIYGAGLNRPGLGLNPKQQITIGSQSVKKVQSDVHIDRKTFKVIRDKDDPTKLSVVFNYFAKSPSTLMVILACQEEKKQNRSSSFKASDGFPTPTSYQIEGTNQQFPAGVITIDLNLYSVEALTTVRQGQYYPIVFFMHANNQTSMRNILCCQFVQNGSNFDLKVAKHTIYFNGHYYNTEEIFGLGDSEVGQGQEMNPDDLAGDKLCIICFSEMKDTMLIPCRHLCVCVECAKTLSKQPSSRRLCPICRQGEYTLTSGITSFLKLKSNES